MFYAISIIVPANTTRDNPKRDTLPVTMGTITRVMLRWRWGIGDLGGCRVLYHETALWPRNRNSWIPSFHESIEYAEGWPLNLDPSELVIETYNTDDTHEHAFWIGVEIMRSRTYREFMIDIARVMQGVING